MFERFSYINLILNEFGKDLVYYHIYYINGK
jgi:hypothetical protein